MIKNGIIKKAVFPVAGFGTRFLPATKGHAKRASCPLWTSLLIQYAAEEAVLAAGIDYADLCHWS